MGNGDQGQPGPIEEQVHTFVVKFWQESDAPNPPFWRGHITHIPSATRAHLQHAAQLYAFIRRYLDLPDDPRPDGP